VVRAVPRVRWRVHRQPLKRPSLRRGAAATASQQHH